MSVSIDFFLIHGMGAAVNRAVELALELKLERNGFFTWTIETSTVGLIDDLIDDENVSHETRNSSAIHIHIRKVNRP